LNSEAAFSVSDIKETVIPENTKERSSGSIETEGRSTR
jgi:hypothetical protein